MYGTAVDLCWRLSTWLRGSQCRKTVKRHSNKTFLWGWGMVQRHIKAGALVELLFLTDPSRTILLINASASAFNDSVCGSMNVGSCRSHRPLVIRLRRRQPLSAPTVMSSRCHLDSFILFFVFIFYFYFILLFSHFPAYLFWFSSKFALKTKTKRFGKCSRPGSIFISLYKRYEIWISLETN